MFIMRKATDVTADELAEAYAFPPPDHDRPVVRANMVTSVDGSATADGRSGGLGSDNDHRIFHLQRRLADAILVGAQTAVSENYGVPATSDGRTPLLVLASRSLSIPADYETVRSTGVVIATCSAAPADARAQLTAAGATVVDCGTSQVEPALVVAEIARRGARAILCEGGPRFLAEVAAAGLLDQLALTVSPVLVGGEGPRIAHEATIGGHGDRPGADLALRHCIGDDAGFQYQLWDVASGAR